METITLPIQQHYLKKILNTVTLGGAIFSLCESYGSLLVHSTSLTQVIRHLIGASCVIYQSNIGSMVTTFASFVGELFSLISSTYGVSLMEMLHDPISIAFLSQPGEALRGYLANLFPMFMSTSEVVVEKPGSATIETAGYDEVWKGFKQSKFAQSLVLFLTTAMFGNLLLTMETYATNAHLKYLLKSVKWAIDNGGGFAALLSFGTLLATDFIPACIAGDINSLSPNTYMLKIECITKLSSSCQRQEYEMLAEAISKWKGSLVLSEDPMLLHIAKRTLIEMKEMVVSNRDSYMSTMNRSLVEQLTGAEVCLNNLLLQGTGRLQPMCFGLTGPAGVGKSEFVDACVATLAGQLQLTMLPDNDNPKLCKPPKAMNLNIGDKFYDNISSSTQVILVDDIGIVNAPVSVALYTAFMAINGSVPYSIPRADIANKSGQFFNNKLTFVTSNKADYGHSQFITDSEAFWRRIIVDIKFVVVSRPGEPMMVEYKVSCFRGASHPREIFEAKTLDELLLLCKRETAIFVDKRNVYRKAKDKKMVCCNRCKELTTKCRCDVVEKPAYQGSTLTRVQKQSLKMELTLYINQAMRKRALTNIPPPAYVPPIIPTPPSLLAEVEEEEKTTEAVELLVFDPFPTDLGLFFDAFTTQEVIVYTILEEIICFILKLLLLPSIPNLLTMPYDFTFYSCIGWYFVFAFCRYMTEEADWRRSPIKFFLFLILTVFNFIPALLVHLSYNVSLVKPGLVMGWIHYVSYLSNVPMLGSLANDLWYTPYIKGPMYARNMRKGDVVHTTFNRDTYVEASWVVFLGKLGIAALLLKYIASWITSSTSSKYTMLGMPALPEDQASSDRLAKMVESGYKEPQTGVTNTFNKTIHTSTPIYSTANPPAYIAALQTICEGKVWKAFGWVNDGRLYTVRHFAKTFQTTTINISYRDKVYTTSFAPENVIYDRHDIASVPLLVSDQAKRLNIRYDYHPDPSDTFEVGGVEYGFKSMVYGENEPNGCFMINFVSKLGNSGLPVFWKTRAGKAVKKEFVGMISRMTLEGSYAIVCPITIMPPMGVTYCLDADIVRNDLIPKVSTVTIQTHSKSILGHLDKIDRIGDYVATVSMPPSKSDTKVRRSELYPIVSNFDSRIENLAPPHCNDRIINGNYISPFLATARQMSSCGEIVDHSSMSMASSIVLKEVLSVCDFSECAPFTIHQTIHGTSLTQPLNRTTSAGFGLGGKKDDYVVGSFDSPIFTRQMAENLIAALESIDAGNPIINYAKASVKDEVIAISKSEEGLERVFFVGGMVYLLLCRQYLGPIMEIFMINRASLFGQIGMNAIGVEFHNRLTAMMNHVGSDASDINWFDSDFSKYDKTLFILRYAVNILHQIVDTSAFYRSNPKESHRIHTIINGLAEYVMILRNDVFIMHDKMPSGVFGTAWVNCLCEAIIEVVQFHYLNVKRLTGSYPVNNLFVAESERVCPFFKNVALINYGDDNLKCVKPSLVSVYSHDGIMRFSEVFCMKITPAHKSSLRIEAKQLTDVLFLKRTPRYHDVLQRYVGALDTLSISKMLAFTDSDDPRWRTAVIDQAFREASLHPRDFFLSLGIHLAAPYSYEDASRKAESSYTPVFDIINVEFMPFELPSPVSGASNKLQIDVEE